MQLDPISGLVGLAGCLVDWIVTRPWKKVLYCFVPLLLAASVGGLVIGGARLDRDTMANNYLTKANIEVEAWESEWAPAEITDESIEAAKSKPAGAPKGEIPKSAELLFRRVQQLQRNDSRSMFFVAMCFIQRGATQQGMSMLSQIAPLDRVGYLPAHAFMLEQYFGRPVTLNDIIAVKHHAEATLRWDRAPPQLLAAIAQLFEQLKQTDNAVKAMRQAADRDANFNLPLAMLTRVHKEYKLLAEESVQKSIKHFESKIESHPQDANSRILLAETYRQIGDLEAAKLTLEEGLRLGDNQILKTALSDIYLIIFNSTSGFHNGSWTGNVEMLDRAYRTDPNNMHIFEEVAKLARASGTSPNEELMGQLRKYLAEGKATSITHMWIAEHYLATNQYAKAIPHLEQSVKRDPNAANCWNNLAYCVADLYPDRLEEARKQAEQALAIAPNVPDFHDTHGTILMKLHRTGDAVAAFEKAIELAAKSQGVFPLRPDYHLRLAEAYREAGDTAMGEVHDKMADEVTQRMTAMQKQAEEAAAQAASNTNTTAPEANATTDGVATEAPQAPAEAPVSEKSTEPTTTVESASDKPKSPSEAERATETPTTSEPPQP